MGFNLIVAALALVLVVGVLAQNKDCINQKYVNDLGTPYSTCHDRSQALPVPRMKQCYEEVMKQEGVVLVAANGQKTVSREKFGQYANDNKNKDKNVGKAMKSCYDTTRADDRMYQEAARASQCVFDKMKQGC